MDSRFVRLAGVAGALSLAFALSGARTVHAQVITDARRLGMGGVLLSEVSGSASQNVAYRAVPRSQGLAGVNVIPIPLGLLQVIVDPPEFDSANPNFNAFQLFNLISRTPYTLQLIEPEELSSDITIDVAKDSLVVDLGDLQSAFPDESRRFGTTLASPNLEFGTPNIFAGVRPQSEVRNTLDLDPNLQQALGEAQPFAPNTTYGIDDFLRGQGVLAFMLGGAVPLKKPVDAPEGDPRRGGKAIYVGARAKYLSGVALWQADATGTFATGDTIFGTTTPVDAQYQTDVRQTANPKFNAGKGYGFDAGVAFFVDRFEIGVGVNDIGAIVDWDDTNLDRFTYDTASNSNEKTPIERGTKYRTHFPTTGTLNVAYRKRLLTLGATLDRTANERWIPRAGAESWLGPTAVRGGVYLDGSQILQATAGVGVQLGVVGFDLAFASHSRGVATTRGLEMAASIELHRQPPQ